MDQDIRFNVRILETGAAQETRASMAELQPGIGYLIQECYRKHHAAKAKYFASPWCISLS